MGGPPIEGFGKINPWNAFLADFTKTANNQ